jgi:drug/metabolite transporter (DMT)-like permease
VEVCIVLGYFQLVVSTVLYGFGVVAQSMAARRADQTAGAAMGLLRRLASDKLYLLGFAGQSGGFVLAFFARASLPLYLVQAGSSAAVGWAALFGMVVLGWRIRPLEIVVLLMMAVGVVLLVAASTPSPARDIPGWWGLVMLAVLVAGAVLTVRMARVNTVIPLAVLAGVAFSVVAISSRSLAAKPLLELPFHPLTWLMALSALIGQAAMAVALQRGSATSTVASTDATSVVLVSVVGLIALGDQIAAGRQAWVALGLTLVTVGVLALSRLSRNEPATTPAAAEVAV